MLGFVWRSSDFGMWIWTSSLLRAPNFCSSEKEAARHCCDMSWFHNLASLGREPYSVGSAKLKPSKRFCFPGFANAAHCKSPACCLCRAQQLSPSETSLKMMAFHDTEHIGDGTIFVQFEFLDDTIHLGRGEWQHWLRRDLLMVPHPCGKSRLRFCLGTDGADVLRCLSRHHGIFTIVFLPAIVRAKGWSPANGASCN